MANEPLEPLARLVADLLEGKSVSPVAAASALASLAKPGPVPPAPPATGVLPSRLLTPKDAADRLGVSPRWLYRHADSLPFTRRLSRRVLRFHEGELEKYLRHKRP